MGSLCTASDRARQEKPEEEEDHEAVTDLLTVFFGLGVLSANAALRDSRRNEMLDNRIAGRVSPPSPHTTVHAGPHTAVRRRT